MAEDIRLVLAPGRGVASSLILIGCLLALPACDQNGADSDSNASVAVSDVKSEVEEQSITFVNTEPPSNTGDRADALAAAADRLWQARIADDFASMYEFQRADFQEANTMDAYIEWSEANEPFKWESFEIGEVYAQGQIGWVEVQQSVAMRRMPSVPPRDTRVWEPWMHIEDRWLPVNSPTAGNLPQTPAIRDIDAETELAERFEKSWQYRHDREWAKLFDMMSSESKSTTTAQQFADAQDLLIFVQCRVEWVEVIDDAGRIGAFVQFKYNDPSLQKMQPKTTLVIERWIRENGEWVLHNPATAEQNGADQQ